MFLFLPDNLYQPKMFLTNEGPLFVAKGRAREDNGTAATLGNSQGMLTFSISTHNVPYR